MKKIGIFTYKHSNYGAVLQCYALQRYIRNNSSHMVEVVDFTTKLHYKTDKLFRKRSNNPFKQFAFLLLTLLRLPALKARQKRTAKFKRDYIKWSSLYDSEQILIANPPKYDIYCTGSDQVFNLSGNYKNVYFLHFNTYDGEKVAYAPSFGSTPLNQNTADALLPYLKDYKALSCREEDGARFMSEITRREVPLVLDPTLLLTKYEWMKVAKKPNYRYDYILVYDLNGGKELISIAKNVQLQHHLPIICITDKVEAFYHINKQIYGAGPAEFIGLFANAKYIVTDSFHGTVFSIIFSKSFSSYIAFPAAASRIQSLLKKLNLEDRIITKGTLSAERSYSLEEINVTNQLKNLREQSYKYIKKYIIQ